MKLVICLLFIYDVCYSQVVYQPLNTGPCSYSLSQQNAFSFTNNQAALVNQKNISIGVAAVNKFLLPLLNSYTAVTNFPLRSDHFGLTIGHYAFNNYKESKIGLAYARKLTDKFDAGVQFNYTNLAIAGYGNASAVSCEAATVFHVSEKFHTGFHIVNPVAGKFGKSQQEKLSSVYALGFGYDASKQFFAGIEIVKEELRPIYINTGVYYSIDPSVIIKAGLSSYASVPWIGAAVCWRSIAVDINISLHPQLGPISTFAFSYELKRKEE